jgi:hypothetical protein
LLDSDEESGDDDELGKVDDREKIALDIGGILGSSLSVDASIESFFTAVFQYYSKSRPTLARLHQPTAGITLSKYSLIVVSMIRAYLRWIQKLVPSRVI